MKNEYDYLNFVEMDFSVYEEESVSEKEITIMKKNVAGEKKTNKKKAYILVACAAVMAISCTAFASGFVDGIIKTISTGHNKFFLMDADAPNELPDEMKGKLFDENGVQINSIKEENLGKLYDEDGEVIDNERLAEMFSDALGGDVKVSLAEAGDDYKPNEKNYATIDEAQKDAAFDIKAPQYMPEGYGLSRACTYLGESGVIEPESSLYMTLEYQKEDKQIMIFERLINEETAFETGTSGKMEEIDINGCKAVIMDDTSISWETKDNVSVSIIGKGNVGRDELIKIAKSVK